MWGWSVLFRVMNGERTPPNLGYRREKYRSMLFICFNFPVVLPYMQGFCCLLSWLSRHGPMHSLLRPYLRSKTWAKERRRWRVPGSFILVTIRLGLYRGLAMMKRTSAGSRSVQIRRGARRVIRLIPGLHGTGSMCV